MGLGCYNINASEEMVDWIGVSRVTYTRYSGDRANKCRGHLYRCPPEPSAERVIVSLVEVQVELQHYLLYRRAVILCHIRPTLGIQHYPYSRGALIELLFDGPSLDNDPALMIVAEVTVPDLIPQKASVVIYMLGTLLIVAQI
jgi:hypothetical protein